MLNRGRKPANSLNPEVASTICQIYETELSGYNFCHATDVLAEGELVQMDASSFDWLGNGSYLHLHGAVDDATGRILALHFEKEETFEGYCELMFQMNRDGHLPREIYTDGRTVFAYDSKNKKKLTIAEELAGKTEKQPHFARALKEQYIVDYC